MFFDVALYIALIIFAAGTVYKVVTWFRRSIGLLEEETSGWRRFFSALRGIFGVVFSAKILSLLKVFILDVLLQRRVVKESISRWVMHMLIFWGFMLLLLMHALDSLVTTALFPDYFSTLNPFMFLRDLFGAALLVGVGIAVYRRIVMNIPRLHTTGADRYALIILAIIAVSGIFLEGLNITSHTRYQEMVQSYTFGSEEELRALEAYWVENFGVVSPQVKGPFDDETMALGAEMHEMSCAACHSRPQWAFAGYGVAKAISPVAVVLDNSGLRIIMWYIHFLACFVGLAYLPFSKMFHILASPVSLLANAVMDKETSEPANIATRQIMELDACTHCGTCSRHCSVAVAFHLKGNATILPSEKIQYLKDYAAHKELDQKALRSIQEGAYLCTNCDRCTVVCPVGINLRELWFSVKEEMIRREPPVPLVLSPFSFYRGLQREQLPSNEYSKPLSRMQEALASEYKLIKSPDKIISLTPVDHRLKHEVDRSSQARTYAYCFSCETCTTVCPVVENYENPEQILGLLPHQIMRALGLGVKDLALGAHMLWDCVTCYQCQEHCPQGVKVTDILYEVKNLAIKQGKSAQECEETEDSK